MTKSKSVMVTKVITHLLKNTLPVLVIKSGKFFFTTTGTSKNVTIVRCRMSLATIMGLGITQLSYPEIVSWSELVEFFVVKPILSDLAIMCRLRL